MKNFEQPSLLLSGRGRERSGPRETPLLALVLRIRLWLWHAHGELAIPSRGGQRQEVSIALVAVPRVATPHIRRRGVRLGVLRNTEAPRGHGGDAQARGARCGGIGRIVGEPDCALF